MSGGPYILGASLSFVDLLFVPFLERMAASLPYFKGFESRSPHFPALLKWYEAMDGRPAYQGIKSDYVSMGLGGTAYLHSYLILFSTVISYSLSLMYIYMLVYIYSMFACMCP